MSDRKMTGFLDTLTEDQLKDAMAYRGDDTHPAPQPAQPDLEERIDNAIQAMAETHSSWESRCHAIMAAMGFNFGWDDPQHDDAQAALTAKVEELTRERDGFVNEISKNLIEAEAQQYRAETAEARVAQVEEEIRNEPLGAMISVERIRAALNPERR